MLTLLSLGAEIVFLGGVVLQEEQLRILKFMSEMTGRIDMNDFASKVGLSSAQIVQNMQALAKEGYLKKVGAGFAMTDKGRRAVKASVSVLPSLRFQFYFGLGQPAGVSAMSIREFHDVVGKVNVVSVEFHVERGDFENWFRTTIEDPSLADDFASLKTAELKGEELRKAVSKAVEARYPV